MAQRRFALLSSDDVPGFEGCGFGYSKFNATEPLPTTSTSHPSPQNFSFGAPGIFGVPSTLPEPNFPRFPLFPFFPLTHSGMLGNIADIKSPITIRIGSASSGAPQPMRAAAPATAGGSLDGNKMSDLIKHLGISASAPNLTKAADQVSDIVKNFDEILQKPFPDSIKSTKDTIQKGRDNYLILQRNTIPIAQDLYNYSQAAILYITNSLVTKKVPFATALEILKAAAQQRAQNAEQVTKDHIAYKDQFDKTVNDLTSLMNTYNDTLATLKSEITRLEKEHRDFTITASVFGALTVLFPLGWLITAPIMIGTAIKAADLQTVIDQTVRDRNNVQSIIDFLTSVLAKLKVIGTNLNDIIKIWGDIEDNLRYIIDMGYGLMEGLDEPLQFQIDDVISKWNEVKTSAKQYLDKVRAPTS